MNIDFVIAGREPWLRETNNVRGHRGKAIREEVGKIADGRLVGRNGTKQSEAFVYVAESICVEISPPNRSGDANDGGADGMATIRTADVQYLRSIEERNPMFFSETIERKLLRINGKSGY
jgi:hypothetical protein